MGMGIVTPMPTHSIPPMPIQRTETVGGLDISVAMEGTARRRACFRQ